MFCILCKNKDIKIDNKFQFDDFFIYSCENKDCIDFYNHIKKLKINKNNQKVNISVPMDTDDDTMSEEEKKYIKEGYRRCYGGTVLFKKSNYEIFNLTIPTVDIKKHLRMDKILPILMKELTIENINSLINYLKYFFNFEVNYGNLSKEEKENNIKKIENNRKLFREYEFDILIKFKNDVLLEKYLRSKITYFLPIKKLIILLNILLIFVNSLQEITNPNFKLYSKLPKEIKEQKVFDPLLIPVSSKYMMTKDSFIKKYKNEHEYQSYQTIYNNVFTNLYKIIPSLNKSSSYSYKKYDSLRSYYRLCFIELFTERKTLSFMYFFILIASIDYFWVIFDTSKDIWYEGYLKPNFKLYPSTSDLSVIQSGKNLYFRYLRKYLNSQLQKEADMEIEKIYHKKNMNNFIEKVFYKIFGLTKSKPMQKKKVNNSYYKQFLYSMKKIRENYITFDSMDEFSKEKHNYLLAMNNWNEVDSKEKKYSENSGYERLFHSLFIGDRHSLLDVLINIINKEWKEN